MNRFLSLSRSTALIFNSQRRLQMTGSTVKTALSKMQAASAMGLGVALLLASCSSVPVNSNNTASQLTKKAPVVALVLGGGGAKGFAHIGVIKVLEENGIHPDLVVGSSVGSFVGSIYASGKSASELEQIALNVKNTELTDFTIAHQGIIEGNKLRSFINTQVNNQPIENFPIRFAAVATEKRSLKKSVFTQGEAGLIVQASSSVPNIFIAPRIPEKMGKKYIDGGVSSMVPVDAAKNLGADIIIAVDVLNASSPHNNKDSNQRNIWSLMDQAYVNKDKGSDNKVGKVSKGKYNQSSLTPMQAEINRADIVIRPNVDFISTFDTTQRQKAITAGEVATKAHLADIKKTISEANASFSVSP